MAKKSDESEKALGGIEMKMKAYGADLDCPTSNAEHICTGSVSEFSNANVSILVMKLPPSSKDVYIVEEGKMVFNNVTNKRRKIYTYFDICILVFQFYYYILINQYHTEV